jgi:hypothetical protein
VTPEEVIGLAVVVLLGLPGAWYRPHLWPLPACFGVLALLLYGFGVGYSRGLYAGADALTFGAISVLLAARWHAGAYRPDWRDLVVLALFVPSTYAHGFISDQSVRFWVLWMAGILQYVIAAPWQEMSNALEFKARRQGWSA